MRRWTVYMSKDQVSIKILHYIEGQKEQEEEMIRHQGSK